MLVPVSRRAAVVALAAGLAACASRPKFTGLPVVRKIAFVPATEPLEFAFENQNAAIGALFLLAANRERRKAFNAALASSRPVLAPLLNDPIVAAVREAGYTVDVLDQLKRDREEPDKVELDKISTDAEAILQVSISYAGLLSEDGQINYAPRVKVAGKLYIRARNDDVYDEDLNYGSESTLRVRKQFAGDKRYAYPTLEVAVDKLPDVREGLERGTQTLARALVKDLRDALATKTVRG